MARKLNSLTNTLTKPIVNFSSGQTRALKNIFRFLAAMLVFTVVARGTAGATVAKVTLTTPYSGDVENSFSIDATIESSENSGISLPNELTITKVLVIPGQAIKKGDPVAHINTKELKSIISTEQSKLDTLNFELRKAQQNDEYTDDLSGEAETDLLRAEQDCARIVADGEIAIRNAENALDKARAEQREAQAELDALAGSIPQEKYNQALDAIDSAQADLTFAHENFEKINGEVSGEIQQAQARIDAALKAQDDAQAVINALP